MSAPPKNFGQCACGIKGSVKRVSPGILEGGRSRDSQWEIESEGRTHTFRTTWSDDNRRYEQTCEKST